MSSNLGALLSATFYERGDEHLVEVIHQRDAASRRRLDALDVAVWNEAGGRLTGAVHTRFAGAKLLLTLRDSQGIKVAKPLVADARGRLVGRVECPMYGTTPDEPDALSVRTGLFALRRRLTEELVRVGRLAWVEEECVALAAQPVVERVVNPNAFAGLKGARDLPPRNLGILRELYELREQLARAIDRPPFKILGEETLVRLAQALPGDATAMASIPGCTPKVIARWGDAILVAVARAQALPETALPTLERHPRPRIPAIVARRIEALRRWRTEASPRFGLEPGLLLPNRLITMIATASPLDPDELASLHGVRRWRAATFGAEIIAALASP